MLLEQLQGEAGLEDLQVNPTQSSGAAFGPPFFFAAAVVHPRCAVSPVVPENRVEEGIHMNRDELRAQQAPLKQRYRDDPAAALVTLKAEGRLGDGLSCSIATGRALVEAGLHPATGGTGMLACSGDMLLQALVACAGVTLSAVATALGIELRGGHLTAEGDLDFRGTLGVAKDTQVGFICC